MYSHGGGQSDSNSLIIDYSTLSSEMNTRILHRSGGFETGGCVFKDIDGPTRSVMKLEEIYIVEVD